MGVGAIALIAGILMLQLWRADLHVPFTYNDDALVAALVVKSVAENGWYLDNPRLGWPSGLQLHDFPIPDVAQLFVVKVMAWFTGDWPLLMNLYFLLGFPLIAISAVAVFRHFGVSWRPAIVGAVLYAFLPSRLLKGEAHLLLDVFYQVPLGVLVALWVCEERPPLLRARDGDREGGRRRWPALDLRNRRSLAAILICIVVGTTGLYYAFFIGFLLVTGGIWASIGRREARNGLAGVALAGIILVTLAASASPTLLYQRRLGANPQAAWRSAGEAEVQGLKIAQLLLPVDGHRLQALYALKDRYNRYAPLVNENTMTSLGIGGSLGFLALLGILLLRAPARRARDIGESPFDPAGGELLRSLAVLNVLAVLLATIGGFGSLVALLVTPDIRTYSRINVVIGFLALFAVVLLLDRLGRRHRWFALYAMPAALGLGLLDQVPMRAIPAYAAIKKTFSEEESYFRLIEDSGPARGMIFELPYQSFPEGPSINGLRSYDPIRGYLHTRAVRWSFPTMRGRAGDNSVREIVKHDPARMVDMLADAEVSGILLDRFGYPTGDSTMEKTLQSSLGAPPIVGVGGRYAFFDLGPYNRRARAHGSPQEKQRRHEHALNPLTFEWTNGCYDLESDAYGPFHWCSSVGEIQVTNPSGGDREASIEMTMIPAQGGARMAIEGDLTSMASTEMPREGLPFARVVTVPAGRHTLRFLCDGRPAAAPNDARKMLWRAAKFSLAESP